MPRGKCQATKQNGEPCPSPALNDRPFCFAHDPQRAKERRQAQAKGGRNKSNVIRLRNLAPPRLLPIYDKLEQALEEVHSGKLSPAQAGAMAQLARALAAILQAGEFEERLRALEGNTPIQAKDWRVR